MDHALRSSSANPGGSTAAKYPAFMDPARKVGPWVGPTSSTYSYTNPFSNNFEVEQTPLPPRDRRRIDIDPSVPCVEPVGDIAVRDGAYAPGERPPVTPDLTHVPSELDIPLLSSAIHDHLPSVATPITPFPLLPKMLTITYLYPRF